MSSMSSTSTFAKMVAETGHLVVAQRVDHVVGELLAGYVADRRLWHAPLDLVSDGLHQVGLAHADAAIEEQRVISFRRTFGDCLAGSVGKLVSAADHEGIEGVTRIELRGAIPVEARLRGTDADAGCREAAIMSHRSRGRIVFRRHELHIVEAQTQNVDRFLNQVRVFVTGVTKFTVGTRTKRMPPLE